MDVQIQELRLPGIGYRYELQVDNGRYLIVVVHEGSREIAISTGDQDPLAAVTLSYDQAVAVAALLTGARFSIEPQAQTSPTGNVGVET